MDLPSETARWAAQAVGSGAVIGSVRGLIGATSSTLYALDIRRGATVLPCVLRCYDNAVWMAEEPDVPQREAAALEKVRGTGLAVPSLIACDPTGAQSGGLPTLLMTRLPGCVRLIPDDLDRWLSALAEALLPVHALPAGDFPWEYGPYADMPHLKPPPWSRVPHLWKQAIAIAQGPAPPTTLCFIHRDYHPNNVLWQGGQITGIVDWPNACRGAAHVDVSWCRMNLIFLHGISAADRFLRAYHDLAGPSFLYHPYWDLLALMEQLPGPPQPYPPWAEFGVRHLTANIMRARIDGYLERVIG